MPGFTSECQSGQHQACASRECRCMCHPWTQELMRAPLPKTDPKGGVRRKLSKKQQKEVLQLPPSSATMEVLSQNSLHNTCPKCGAIAKPTDIFCRRDGEKLILGKQCFGCHAPLEPDDEFCWQCGLKAGEKPAPSQTEDVLLRLQELAVKKGLLKPGEPVDRLLYKETAVG